MLTREEAIIAADRAEIYPAGFGYRFHADGLG